MMAPDSWRQRRTGWARTMLEGDFSIGLGRLDRVEPCLAAALSDILSRSGSMLRAVTCYMLGIDMGMPEAAARAVGCGIEYLHTASLIFDDLPAMDDARTRRGAACLHLVHGEAMAMLTALALVNRGYALLWQGIGRADAGRRELAGQWVDARLGISGVIGGQAFDLRGWHGVQCAEEVSEVAARKTGELLRLTLVLPAIIGRGTTREIQLLDRLALLRGLAYQAADDLKDVYTHGESHGKTGGRDEELGRPNMVAAEGIEATLQRFHRLQQMGDRVVAALPAPAERWEILETLRVPLPPGVTEHALTMAPAAG